MLLNKGANINIVDGLYNTALQAATNKGHRAVVKLLLNHGANINAQGSFYSTTL